MTVYKARSIHPGEVLQGEFLVPLGVSVNALALQLGVPEETITAIISGESNITPETAALVAHAFNTTPEFWINLQAHYDQRAAGRRA